MSTFSECEFSKCILTTNEEFILRKQRNGITKFDAVAINIESSREDEVQILNTFPNYFITIYCMKFYGFMKYLKSLTLVLYLLDATIYKICMKTFSNIRLISLLQKAQKISQIIQSRDSKQIYIMRMRESPRPDMKTSFVNQKYFSE